MQFPSSSATRRPIIAQTAPSTPPTQIASTSKAPSTPASEPSDKATSPSALPKPLIPDPSQCTNPDPTPPESDSTTLEELAHFVRLSRYQERKRANTRTRLQRSLVSTALSARLTRCGEIAHRSLVDCFRSDDKKTFATLYNAINDVRRSCDELRRYSLLEPDIDAMNSPVLESSASGNAHASSGPNFGPSGHASASGGAPFLNDISASSRETFLQFLIQIRTNPDYLAARLCSLTSSELTSLTSFYQALEPIESVLPPYNRPVGRTLPGGAPSRGSVHGSNPNPIARLLSFQRHDPLSALVHTCFANSAGPDSSEDRRRTDIWATACARLISDSRSGLEPILLSILNIWSSMRDWSGKSNMQWYLMKILEDGSFLLDRAEDQHGTRFHISEWPKEVTAEADEFYRRAVDGLFDVIDDEDATGIPEGFIELSNEILRRLDANFVDSTRRFLVCRWLFQHFLLRVIIHPESYGLMAEYHITEYGRQKILRQVAMRAMQIVIDLTNPPRGKKPAPVSVPPKIQAHVERILSRFRGAGAPKPTAKLFPARSITSLRETVEVHPYLVVSPADLLTLVNALFPEQRPHSRASSSLRSGAASISGFSAISQPASMHSRPFDTASVISTTESVASDTPTSQDPDHRSGTPQRYSPPVQDALQARRSTFEEDGYRLRLALHDMKQRLGHDAVNGACHPCAERWAVLFISGDGTRLSTRMTYDPDDEGDEDENSSTTESDEEEDAEEASDLATEYPELRESILKLVEDYEIPRDFEPERKRTPLSNRASGIKKYRNKNKIITPEKSIGNKNPYRRQQAEDGRDGREGRGEGNEGAEKKSGTPQSGETQTADSDGSALIAMLKAACTQSQAQSDYVSAHTYWKTLQQLNSVPSSLRTNGFAVLLNIFSRGPRDSSRRSAFAIEEYDAWLVWLKQSQERHEGLIDSMTRQLRALRDKMWYVTDVRNSAAYEYSRNICVALKTMGLSRNWRSKASAARGTASAAYIYRTESQIMELLAATEGQGGPNKLSDDQAENTSVWLKQSKVQSGFCNGEERIHRFCLEVDNCIGKLIGETMESGPVLWSSHLYSRDLKILDAAKKMANRDSLWTDDNASIISDSERRFVSGSGSGLRPLAGLRDLRNISTYNSSQQSIGSGHFSFARINTNFDGDGHDYFGASSPVHTIDSMTTYYSPFQSAISPSSATSRAHSPNSSLTNLSASFSYPYTSTHPATGRPGTATSSNETVYQQRLSEEKSRFLDDLRQTLTSLLLSDLGNLVFAKGSETDVWFEDLGQQCIDRRDAMERKAKRAAAAQRKEKAVVATSATSKPRILGKKKSFGNLRGAGESDAADSAMGYGNDSSATSDTVSARSRPSPSNRDNTGEFPFRNGYERLLRQFCVHPNPQAKLNALRDLKHLIIASLGSGSRRGRHGWTRPSDFASTATEDQGATVKTNPLEDAIDNMEERRQRSIQQHPPPFSPISPSQPRSSDTKSLSPLSPTATENSVTSILLSLFRDASIRPKTLFRDLQFIAAFVPAPILDSDRGIAFWDTGLAAIKLKQEVCETMISVADNVVDFHSQNRSMMDSKLPDSLETPPKSSTPPPPTSAYSLKDAGRMVIITAKEGFVVSQRELGLFYLSHPELIDRVTMPLSKPREVFMQSVMETVGSRRLGGTGRGLHHPGEKPRSSSGGAGTGSGGLEDREEDVRSDPALMCVAVHWMQAAEKGGDKIAANFIKQQQQGMMG